MEQNFIKHASGPVFGNKELGTCFDVYVTYNDGKYRMDFSWRPMRSLALCFSDDGISWDSPIITLSPDPNSDWEQKINRNCVLYIDGKYKMWYTGQANGKSCIGYAESEDGIHFERVHHDPVLIAEYEWEMPSVMNPCVIFENGIYKMWYSAGENYEPCVLAYAESKDGISWKKHGSTPVFRADTKNTYEQNRVGGCQVIPTEDMGYVMFYIGYEDINTARICIARSPNGIDGWERCPLNPIVAPTPDSWDADSCYKPSVIWNEAHDLWQLWYNGRKGDDEFIGYAYKYGRQLF